VNRLHLNLFLLYGNRLYDLACTILRDPREAEDAVQDTFLRVWKKIGSFEGRSALETWLVAITVNVCRGRLRKRKARRLLSLDHIADRWLTSEDTATTVNRQQARQALWSLVDRLSDRYRLPIILRYRYDMPCREIGEVLGLATTTIYERLSIGRKKLREMVVEQENKAVSPTTVF